MKRIISTAESFENVANNMKATKEARTEYNKIYCSLSKVLRNMQTKTMLPKVSSIFTTFGLPTNGKVKPADVEKKIANWYEDKKGNKYPCYTSKSLIKDEQGNPVLDAKGEKTYKYTCTPVRDGQWSIEKLVKVLASK